MSNELINLDRFKEAWKDQKPVQEKNITADDIRNCINIKSSGVISQYIKETKTGMHSSAALPLIGILFFFLYGISVWSIILLFLFVIASISAYVISSRRIRELSSFDESLSLRVSLDAKIGLIKKYFDQGKLFGPLLGFLIVFSGMTFTKFIETGTVFLRIDDIIVLTVSSVLIVLFTVLMLRVQTKRYLDPLVECLAQIDEEVPELKLKNPKMNIALIITMLLVINVLVFLVAYFIK